MNMTNTRSKVRHFLSTRPNTQHFGSRNELNVGGDVLRELNDRGRKAYPNNMDIAKSSNCFQEPIDRIGRKPSSGQHPSTSQPKKSKTRGSLMLGRLTKWIPMWTW